MATRDPANVSVFDQYHHIVLPRKVPGRAKENIHQLESALLERFVSAFRTLIPFAPSEHGYHLDAARLMLSTCKEMHIDGNIDKNHLSQALDKLESQHTLLLSVTEQNAALLAYKSLNDTGDPCMIFEAFEVSAVCSSVLASTDALQWDFPGQAVVLPADVHNDPNFQDALSEFLDQASFESIKQFAAITQKANASLPEIRDTPDPTLITGLLMSILNTVGTPQNVPLLRKRVRDTVSFKEALKPWRRSSLYLAMRVAIQRHLYRHLGPEIGRMYFKALMCLYISSFLDHAGPSLQDEDCYLVQQKLGRRFAKLEMDCQRSTDFVHKAYVDLLHQLRPVVEKTLLFSYRRLQSNWDAYKYKTRRVISPLPTVANAQDLQLRMTHSGPFIKQALHWQSRIPRERHHSPRDLLARFENENTTRPMTSTILHFIQLAEFERSEMEPMRLDKGLPDAPGLRCSVLARQIEKSITMYGSTFHAYPELLSKQLLTTMELWVSLDRAALECFPCLGEFHPGFHPRILDSLQLSSYDELLRVQTVGSYLTARCQVQTSETIFTDSGSMAFAVRYFDSSSDSSRLAALYETIQEEAEAARSAKEEEWDRLTSKHEALVREKAGLSCVGYRTNAQGKSVHNGRCRWHHLRWQANNIKIDAFEYPLPENVEAAKAVVFELSCPAALAAYRDATWAILAAFGNPKTETSENPIMLIRNYRGLKPYHNGVQGKVTIASSIKSHLDTHYGTWKFPISFKKVCTKYGLGKSRCFHVESNVLLGDISQPSFAQHLSLQLSSRSPYHNFKTNYDNWPSSNMILANQLKCPPGFNVQEFTAWQGLLVGTFLRWPNLLRELGSTNINMSSNDTWVIMSRLILEIGPASTTGPLREIHSAFEDVTFCDKLLTQVGKRIQNIRYNWREPVQMDTLISMISKTHSLSSNPRIQGRALDMLELARTTTENWCASLRSLNSQSLQELKVFAVWASTLCKRVCYMLMEQRVPHLPVVLRSFVTAAIDLQSNLTCALEELQYSLRSAVVRDLVEALKAQERVQKSIQDYSHAFLQALSNFWPVPQEFMDCPVVQLVVFGCWIIFEPHASEGPSTAISFNVVCGTLLVDGQPLGALPPEYQHLPVIEKLFGNRSLRTLPSPLPGMSFVAANEVPEEHRVHFGFRDGNLVVRAQHHGTILELLPEHIFTRDSSFDLPRSLVHNCYHWLDLGTKIIRIRQEHPWKTKKASWQVNLRDGRATHSNGSSLVDPYSSLYRKVINNFDNFEYPSEITVLQPPIGRLAVELKRLDLWFFVNKSGWLQSHQLNALITANQNAGTWYGLLSKIVLCDAKNRSQRSVMLPLGDIKSWKDGQHVTSCIYNAGAYVRFALNEVLGRVECPTEPRLLYTRALWHALTSHFLPDPLTGRTGVEEAIYYLQNANSLPWTPLSPEVANILSRLGALTPPRAYYPPGLKNMETVNWNTTLTTIIQDDRYRALTEHIMRRNFDLSIFDGKFSSEVKAPENCAEKPHLERRGLSRIYAHQSSKDYEYRPRDAFKGTGGCLRVMSISRALALWSEDMSNTKNLCSILERFPIIGGYVRKFDMVQVTDRLDLDYGTEWGALCEMAFSSVKDDKYRLMFTLAPMAFAPAANMELLKAVISFAVFTDVKSIDRPVVSAYSHFKPGELPSAEDLAASLENAGVPWKRRKNERRDQSEKLQSEHRDLVLQACRDLVDSVISQWPNRELDLDSLVTVGASYLDREEALGIILPEWTRLTDNLELHDYLQRVQSVLNQHSSMSVEPVTLPRPPTTSELFPSRSRGGEGPTLQDLLRKTFPTRSPLKLTSLTQEATAALSSLTITHPGAPNASRQLDSSLPEHVQKLRKIVTEFSKSGSAVQKRYGQELNQSIDALSNHLAIQHPELPAFNPTALERDIFKTRAHYQQCMTKIYHSLCKNDCRFRWLEYSGLWPRITPIALLTQLGSHSNTHLGPGIKAALVELGVAITAYQRSLRIDYASRLNKKQQLADERRNSGHENWSPLEFVNWLLLEVESNVMLRPEQVEVALATISPHTGKNSVLQLLMGKGKTSCILPMVALVLADKRNLLRVIVPRPLLLQSAQVLQSKIGGILDREVVHVPFSRRTPTHDQVIGTYQTLHENVMRTRGLMLALPDHILSFKLSGLQRLCDDALPEARRMVNIQAWLDRHSRDVMDECDVSLAIRTQLIYPSGSQTTVDGHPLRWQTVQSLLRLVESHVMRLQRFFPKSVEIVQRSNGGFPLIYFLRMDIEEALISAIVSAICTGLTTIVPGQSITDEPALRSFISDGNVDSTLVAKVNDMFKEKPHLMDVARHLRGLLVHGILLSTMKKRWNVQYGLNPSRDPIAVPYSAKGVPSATAEWGHPDVALILTNLSFYYQGVSMGQVKQAFEELLKTDEPNIEYDKWSSTGLLPESLRNYHGINVEDPLQLRELHFYLRHNINLHDFFLNAFVYPKHAKQFSTKLQASGWDLVLYDQAERMNSRTTGFSGTNDTRHQLPMTISQNDLPGLTHTNAEVLAYLLERRNSDYVCMVDSSNRRLTEEGFIMKLMANRIRILIDAGAQILEHDNKSFAKAWLKLDEQINPAYQKAAGVVFFDATHRPYVMFGKGSEMPLVASPFAEDLSNCLVYLDESHCRGTDLKLPIDATAALTLGPNLTKDALVQAAMRLRLLGTTQSVTFFAPPEVHQGIVDMEKRAETYQPDSSDVIHWLLKQTCDGIEQLEPLYVTQGINFLQRVQAKVDYPKSVDNENQRRKYLSVLQSKEAQTLKQLYEPNFEPMVRAEASAFVASLRPFLNELYHRKNAFEAKDFANHTSAFEEVEQEREMEIQVQSVREIQKPHQFKHHKFPGLHQDIVAFAKSGKLVADSKSHKPMASVLQQTAMGAKHVNMISGTGLLISSQFVRTVKHTGPNDNFLRPCHWLLWSRSINTGMLVSPEEANLLIPIVWENKRHGPVHLIVYAAAVTRNMLQFNNLDYYAMPPLPPDFTVPMQSKIELGLFSGRLYFGWEEYEALLSYLGMDVANESIELNTTVKHKTFSKKALSFPVRLQGKDFDHTPMGFITTGKPLTAEHPFFVTKDDDEGDSRAKAAAVPGHHEDDEDDDDGDDQENDYFFQSDGEEDRAEDDLHDDYDESNNMVFSVESAMVE